MQDRKIKRMAVSKIGKWITAINKLLKDYLKNRESLHCSLCDVSTKGNCADCLWSIMEGEDCYKFASRNDFGFGPKRGNPKWQALRIPMLRRWKKILKAELARRDL